MGKLGSVRIFIGKRKKLSLALLLVAVAAIVWALSGPSGSGRPQVLATAVVKRDTVVRGLDATGIIKPEVGAIVKIGSRATGIIRRMHVRVGDEVREGQVIAEIDSRELKAQMEEAEATLRKAEVEYERIVNTFPLQIAEAEAQVKSARASADYQTINLERRKTLVEQDLDAKDTLDVARQQNVAAQQSLAAAEATLRRIRQEFVRQKESAEQARVQAAAAVTTADIRLSYATIISPIDGIVSQVTAQEGETVVAGLQVANLITVLDPSRLELWVYVDETDVGQVAPGMDVEFKVDSLPGKNFTGQVARIYPEPEVRDSIVYYQTLVPLDKETSLQLRPEMTTQCRVIIGSKEGVLAIPNEALKWVNGERVVYVQRGKELDMISPKIGMQGLTSSEVLEGLEDGEVVATRLTLGSTAAPTPTPRGPGGGRH